jgi:hypothetical protein
MSRVLTASDRSALIRLASTMPSGSEERRAILAGLVRTAGLNIRLPSSYPRGAEKYADKFDNKVPGIVPLKAFFASKSWPGGEPPMLTLGRYIKFENELKRVLPPVMASRINFG